MAMANRFKRSARDGISGKAARADPQEREHPDEQREFDAEEIADGVTKYVRADAPLEEAGKVLRWLPSTRLCDADCACSTG